MLRYRAVLTRIAAVGFAGWGARAQSPFTLTLESTAVTPEHAEVRVVLGVPEKHLVYAETFRVSAEPVRVPQAETKPDPIDPSRRVGVYAKTFESLWRVAPLRDGTELTVAYQGCDDQVCFLPEEHVFRFDRQTGRFVATVANADAEAERTVDRSWTQGLRMVTGGGYMGTGAFLAFLDQAETGTSGTAPAGNGWGGFLRDPVAFFHAHGLALTLVLVLIGGLLLNLTPCVLPMIPINLAILGAGAGTRGRGFALGAAYGAGIVLVYGGLGWLILRTGLFFGALQASPWFSLAVALIFTALTLALFDVFVIDFTRFFTPKNGGARQGALAAFSAGALSALLAGACVAPVVLAVLLLAGTLYAGGATGAQMLPFVLGLGMALPWPFAGAGLSVLPAPGLWMVRVKQAFGVFLALLAAYYFHLAAVGFRSGGDAVAREGSIAAGDRVAWEAAVARARRAGKPIFVDFWATWCKNCTVMERTTFADERVRARLATYEVVKVQAEKPDREPARGMLEAFGVRGLPGFAVLK